MPSASPWLLSVTSHLMPQSSADVEAAAAAAAAAARGGVERCKCSVCYVMYAMWATSVRALVPGTRRTRMLLFLGMATCSDV